MPDFSATRSEYLKVMMGNRKDALAPYRPDQMNDLGDTSMQVASLSDDDINTAIQNMTGTQYEGSDVFKSLTNERDSRQKKAEEDKPKSWLESVGDFFVNIGTSVTEGIFNVVDDIWDFGVGVASGLFGGGWFGAQNDFTDWAANAMTDDRWVTYATDLLTSKAVFNPVEMITNFGNNEYWDNYWNFDYNALEKKYERNYQGMDWLHKGGNFVGEVIPSLFLAYLTGGSSLGAQAAAQGGFAFARGMGEAQSRALSEGASFQESAGYGAVKGAISGALSAGMTYAGGTFASRSADSLISQAGNKVGDAILAKTGSTGLSFAVNTATKFIIRVAGDAGEAAVFTAIEPALQQIYNDDAWYNAYGTEENRKAYAEQIGKAALTAAAFSAVTNIVRDTIDIHKNGGLQKTLSDYEKSSMERIVQNNAMKNLSRAERRLIREGTKEWSSIQKEINRVQGEYETMKARGVPDSEIELFIGKNKDAIQSRVTAYSDKYGKVFTKLSAKVHPDVATENIGKLSAEKISAAKNESFQKLSAMTSKGLKEQMTSLFNGKNGVVGLISYTEGSKPVETVKENNEVIAKPKDFEDVQNVLAAVANDPQNAPTVLMLPLKGGANAIRLSIKAITPEQAKSIAFLQKGDFKTTESGAKIAPIGGGKSIVISQKEGTAEIVPTIEKAQEKPLDLKAEPAVVKEAAQAKEGKVYSYTSVEEWESEFNDALIESLRKNGADVKGFGVLVGADSDDATLKQVFDNLNLGSKEQVVAIRDAVKNELFAKEFTYELDDPLKKGKAIQQKLTFNDLLPQLSSDEKAQLLADFDAMFDELILAGKNSRVTVLKNFIAQQKSIIEKYKAQIRDIKVKKEYVAKLSRTRSKIKDLVTGDYDYGKVEERDIHTINMLAKPIASLKRQGGVYKADSDTLDAFLNTQKYYVPENYETAGSIDFSADVKEALDAVVDLIKQDANKGELSAETYEAIWDYQNAVVAYEKELKRIEITERKPSVYAASAELADYDMSAIQKLVDFIPREFGGAAGELFMRFGYGEITKKFVIEPIKAYGRTQNAVANAVIELGKVMPTKGFHSKHVVGKINGVKVTRGQLISAYISTFLADDNFDDVENGGWGVRNKKGSMKWVTKGGLDSAKADIEKLISDDDKKLAEGLFNFFNGFLKDWFVGFEKGVRHKVDVEVRKNYFPSFKEKDFKAGVDSPVGHTPLFRYEKSLTGDNSGLVIMDVMDIAMDYIKKIAEMENLLPVVKAAQALRNSKTANGKILATEIKDKYGKETLDLLDKSVEGWFKAGKAEIENIAQKALHFLMHGYATSKLADLIRPTKNWFSFVTSNVDLAKMPRALVSKFNEEVRGDVSWLIDNEIYELKYRFESGDVVKGSAPTAFGEIQEKLDNVTMFPVKGIDWVAMKDGLYAIVAEARHRGIDVRSKEGRELVHNIYAMFYLSNVGSTPLHKSKMSEGALRYVFDVLAGAKRAQVASFAMQGSLYHQFKGKTQAQIDADLATAKSNVAKAEAATKKAVDEYENAIDRLGKARQDRDDLIDSKADAKDIEKARDNVKKAKEDVKDKKAKSEQAAEDEAKARSEQKKAENAKEGYAQYKFAGGNRIPFNILAKAILVGALTTGVSMVTKWLYGKKNFDEYEIKEIAQDVALNSFVNWLPVVGDLVSAITKNYEIDAPSVSMINNVISACSELIDSIQNGKVSGSLISSFVDILEGITGLPLGTVKKYVYGIMKMIDPATAYQFNNIFHNVSSTGISSTAKGYAEKNDISTAASLYQSLYAGYKTGEIDREVAVEEAKLVQQGYNPIARNVPEYTTNEEGERQYLTDAQKSKFAKSYGKANEVVVKLIKSAQYKSMDSESKAKAIKKVYDLYYELARYDSLGIDPDSKLGKLLAYCGGDYGILQTLLLIQSNQKLEDTRNMTRRDQALRMVNRVSMPRTQKLLALVLMGYGASEANKPILRNYLKSIGFTKKQAEEFVP